MENITRGNPDAGERMLSVASIGSLLDEFEQVWRAGTACPRIEHYTEVGEESIREVLIRGLLPLDIKYRRLAARTPGLAEYERRLCRYRLLVRHIVLKHRTGAGQPGFVPLAGLPVTAQQSADLGEATDMWCDPHSPRRVEGESGMASVYLSGDATIPMPRDGATRVAGNLPAVDRLGRFDLLGILGQGAYGTVYRAHDPQLDRLVALKVPRAGWIVGPDEAERFLREARAAARLHHPHVVAVFDADAANRTLYIASEFIEGDSLQQLLVSGRRFTLDESSRLVSLIARALDYAHQMGVVHRDIKPANVLIDRAGSPHIADFGLARRADNDVLRTEEGVLLGTPAYMSPEQATGHGSEADGRSDQWSLGVIYYELMAGRRPFDAKNVDLLLHQVRTAAYCPLRRIVPQLPVDLVTICEKCLALEPENRFDSCEQLADEIDRWRRGEPIRSRPITQLERVIRWSKRNPVMASLWTGVCFLGFLSMIVAAGMLMSQRQLVRTEGQLREERVQLESSLDEQERLTDRAEESAELARQKSALAIQREGEARQHQQQLISEQLTSEHLSEQNRRLEDEHRQLQAGVSAAEQRLKLLDQNVNAREQEVLELNQKLADATWQEYVTWLQAADTAWMKQDRVQVEASLGRCPEEWRAWEWEFLRMHAAGDAPEPEYQSLLADIARVIVADNGNETSEDRRPSLPYEFLPSVAISSDMRRVGLWARLRDSYGEASIRRTYLGVADLDASSILSTQNVYRIPWLAQDSNWHQKMVLSDDGELFAATGQNSKKRQFLEVVDLTAPERVLGVRWEFGQLPELAFSENGDRFLAVFPNGNVSVYSLSERTGARRGTILQQFSLASLISAQSCEVKSAVFHNGQVFAIAVRARIGQLGLLNHPLVVLLDDRLGEFRKGDCRIVTLPPEFADVPSAWSGWNNGMKQEFRMMPSVDRTMLAVAGNSTALIDTKKNAIVGEYATPNIVGFSPDGHRLLALEPDGQLEIWDIATGRKLPKLNILRRSVEFLRTLRTRYSLDEESKSWFRFDTTTATFHVLKYDELREVIWAPTDSTSNQRTRVAIKSFFVLGRLCLNAP
jgi:serine/threonine protein kinase/WD40 repeat protein